MSYEKRRIFSIIAVVIIQAPAGYVYIWSVFGAELTQNFGWGKIAAGYVFTAANIVTMIISIFVIKKLRLVLKMKNVIRISAVLIALSLFLSSFRLDNVLLFYIFYGILGGIGNALVYPVLNGYSQELYPDKTGFAGGLSVAGFGLGPVIWAPLAASLMSKFGLSKSFLILGVIFLVIFFIFSLVLVEPNEEFRQKVYAEAIANKKTVLSYSEKDRNEMIKSKEFIPFYITFILGVACGMMIITSISGIMQIEFNFTKERAALIVSLVAIFNASGRFFIAWLSDKIGRFQAVMLVQGTFAISLIIMAFLTSVTPFLILLVFVALSYGGIASLLAPTAGFVYGQKHIVSNYAFLFSAFAVGSLIGPSLYALMPTIKLAFIIASSLALIGFMLAFYLKRKIVVKKEEGSEVFDEIS